MNVLSGSPNPKLAFGGVWETRLMNANLIVLTYYLMFNRGVDSIIEYQLVVSDITPNITALFGGSRHVITGKIVLIHCELSHHHHINCMVNMLLCTMIRRLLQ